MNPVNQKIFRKIKILIIEDDPTWALYVESIIYDSKYELVGSANSFDKSIAMIEGLKPDLIIADIKIQNYTIFDILEYDKYQHLIVLFMTSYLEPEYYNLSLERPKSIFLEKPFHKYTLLSALDLLIKCYSIGDDKSDAFITVRGLQQQLFKLSLNEVTWIQSEGNYSFINTIGGKKYAKKISLSKLSEELDSRFLIIHRGFVVNISYIQRVELGNKLIFVQDNAIPIGRNYRNSLNEFLYSKN